MAPSLLYIPDISGFTKFVNDTEVEHGRHVIAELLELIIESDELGLTVSELEGDAVFFYRDGPLPDFSALVAQAKKTFEAFHSHLRMYETHRICDCGACSSAHRLSLKIVAHAGPIELISVHGFQKPYGSDVIVAHRLLKNDIDETEYLLVTDPARGERDEAATDPEWSQVCDGVASLEDLGDVPYCYVPLAPLRATLPDPPPPPQYEKCDRPVVNTILIDRAPEQVFELITNFDHRLSWNKGVTDFEYEPNRVNRVGMPHRCVIGGTLLEFETITNDFGEGRHVYGEILLDNALVDDVASYYIVEAEGAGARLTLEFHYQPKPFPKSLLAPLVRFRIKRVAPRILAAIKEAAEAGDGPAESADRKELVRT